MIGFVYGQTEYSILENAIHLDDYINHGVSNEFSFLTITDPNMHGHYKFYKKCKANNIKPVIGLEVKINSTLENKNCVLLYAKNKIGYQNLLAISTQQEVNGIVEDSFIKEHSEGLFLVTSVINSDFDQLIFLQRYEDAFIELDRIMNLCNEFYLGVMPSSFIYESICDDLVKIIRKYKLNILPVAKCSYLKEEDDIVYMSLLKIGESKQGLSIDDFHLKTKDELLHEFREFDNIFINLEKVIDSISSDIIEEGYPLPKFPNKANIDSYDYLSLLCNKGLIKRLSDTNKEYDLYKERLEYELSVIKKMGYEDYFLIVWDFVKFAKNNNILVGVGRGSAPGSLVAYSLGITDLDPIEYNLLFERFLNPERISMPDIDVDFPDDKRDFIINYVKEKYGMEHVCYISAFGTFQLKSSVRDLFRINGYDTKYIETIIELLERKATHEEIMNELGSHPELIELIMIAKKIEGLPRHISTHAAGIILSSRSLINSVPLRMGINNMYQSQLEAVDLEQLGLLKMDFLGIRNLSLVYDMITEIKKSDPSFDIRKIPFDDDKTFSLLQQGDTLGIFQLESSGITNVIKKMKPTHFEDLVAILALYRPGPMDNIDTYIKRKHGEVFNYLHPLLEPILKDTYGIIIYQEQIMRIAQVFAGYSLGEADVLRRAVSKKKKEVLDSEREKFVNHSVNNGYDAKVANEIYDYIAKFADYGFNRSHTVAYAIFSYQMAYLKTNYFNVFISKLLNNVIGNDSELANYIKYAKGKGINVINPDVNKSKNYFVIDNNNLLMPINSVHSIGAVVAKKIIEERRSGLFTDFFDFKKRMNKEVNSRMLENLINASFFDSFGYAHSYLLQNSDSEYDLYISKEEAIIDTEEFGIDELRDKEIAALGFTLKYDLFNDYDKYVALYKATLPKDMTPGKKYNVIGIIKRVKKVTTKKGEEMAFVTLDCNNQYLDVVVFSEVYKDYKFIFTSKKLVLLNGLGRMREDNIQLQLSKAKEL